MEPKLTPSAEEPERAAGEGRRALDSYMEATGGGTALAPREPRVTDFARVGGTRRSHVFGIGVETVGTDAGGAVGFEPPFPCHAFFLGNGKYGLTQLQNLAQLPARGAVVVAPPLPIVEGSGSPVRVLALVQR